MRLSRTWLLVVFFGLWEVKVSQSLYMKQVINPYAVPKVTWNIPGLGPYQVYTGVKIGF